MFMIEKQYNEDPAIDKEETSSDEVITQPFSPNDIEKIKGYLEERNIMV